MDENFQNTCHYGRDSITKGLWYHFKLCLKTLLLIEGQAKTEIKFQRARQGLEIFS